MTTTVEQDRRGGSVAGWMELRRRSLQHILDRPLTSYYLLLGASTLLLTIGLLMVLSASSVYSFKKFDGNSYHIFLKQLMWVGLALPCAFLASRLPVRVIRWFAWPSLIVATTLIALTASSLGFEANGNRNWLQIGPMTLQPSEIAKLAVILWCSDLYARKEQVLGDSRHALIPMVPVTGFVTFLVVRQGDLGTALVLFAIILGMLWVVGVPARLFIGAMLTVAVLALYLASASQERLERLTSFVDPFRDYLGSGWQSAHGLFAMSSGGWLGKGISASQQKWGDLPEAHTDFIFAVLGEELGLVGTLLVLGLFLTIAYAGIRVAVRTQDPFVRYMSAGITIWLMSQMMINVGMVLALLPVIGIPLPLVSYGGSALLPSVVALGLLISFARSEPGAAAALRTKRRRHGVGITASGRRSRRGKQT